MRLPAAHFERRPHPGIDLVDRDTEEDAEEQVEDPEGGVQEAVLSRLSSSEKPKAGVWGCGVVRA